MGEKQRRDEFRAQRPGDRLGDAPIEARYRDKMQAIARGLDAALNDGKTGPALEVGFVLLVFPYGDKSGLPRRTVE